MLCPNHSCQYKLRYGTPAEWPEGTRSCPACGAGMKAGESEDDGEPHPGRQVTIAEFGELHEAHLARGRLQAEGVVARVAGEHLASLQATFIEGGGWVRLEVDREDAERALIILERDHSGTIVDVDDEARCSPESPVVCPRCCSASVDEDRGEAGGALAHLLARLRGRRKRCFTCGHRWKHRTMAD